MILEVALTSQNTRRCELPLTFFTSWHVTAPREIPLAHEDLRANQLKSRVALVGDDGAMDEVRVGRALPAVGDLGQLRASVVPLHLCWHCIVLVGEGRIRMGNGNVRIIDILPSCVDTMRKDVSTGNTVNLKLCCIIHFFHEFSFFTLDQDCKETHDKAPYGTLLCNNLLCRE